MFALTVSFVGAATEVLGGKVQVEPRAGRGRSLSPHGRPEPSARHNTACSARLATRQSEAIANGPDPIHLPAAGQADQEASSAVQAEVSKAEVSASARQLNVGAGESVAVTTRLPTPAEETLEIRDENGVTVRTLVDEWRPAGTYVDSWDGKGPSGSRLPDGQYRWVAILRTDGCRVVIDYSEQRDGDAEVQAHPEYPPWNAFDNQPLRFSHVFDRPGEIVLVFARDTYDVRPSCEAPRFFCRFLDGYQPGGVFTYEWAGVDDSGEYRDDINAIFVISHHENLSKNAIVVHGGRPVVSGVQVSPALFGPGAGSQAVRFTLSSFPGEQVSGRVTWTNQESRSALRTIRLERVSPGPFTVEWDGRADGGELVAPGRYTVSVVVTDRHGQTASSEILTRVEY